MHKTLIFSVGFASILFLGITFGADLSTRPSASVVEKNISLVVVFSITPDDSGRVSACAFADAADLKNHDVDFKPSDTFVHAACNLFRKSKWDVKREGLRRIENDYYFCYYSTSAPDDPVCDIRFHEDHFSP